MVIGKKIPKIQVEIRETENLKCIMKMKVHSGQPRELGFVLPIFQFTRAKFSEKILSSYPGVTVYIKKLIYTNMVRPCITTAFPA